MKKISLQWRITLMTAILLCVTCVVMNCLIIYSGKHYMDVIGSGISAYSSNDASRESSAGKLDEKGESSAGADSSGESFNPENVELNHELTIIVDSAQESFGLTGWCITAFMTLLGGVLGLVKCALLLFLAVWVLQKLQLLVTPELVNKTVLLKFFAQNSPIDLIAKL